MNSVTIYKIQSKCKPGRCYIGQSSNMPRRIEQHLSMLKHNKHPNHKLQYHYNKYGRKDLIINVLLYVDEINSVEAEQFFIDSYKSWFNIMNGIDNNRGHHWILSNESKNNMKKGHQRRKELLKQMGKKNYYKPKIRIRKPYKKEIIMAIRHKYNI